jgi:chemotaxis protein MotB
MGLLFASLLGCIVPKRVHEELKAELDMVRAELTGQLADRDNRILSLEEALAAAQQEVSELTTSEAELGARLAVLTEQYGEERAALLKDKSRLRASVADMKQALLDLADRKAAAEARVAAYQDLLERFQTLIDTGQLQVRIVDGRMVLELPNDILFASGKAELSEEGGGALAAVAAVLVDLGRSIQVEGHTDDVPIHNERYPSNWELAADRALVVLRALEEGGVPPEQMSAASFADYKPVADNGSDEGRATNRRTEIVLLPDLSQLPGAEELESLNSAAGAPR